MTERSGKAQNPPAGDERPEVYSVSQDKDGSLRFSRRGFLYVSAAMGGTLLVRRVCPRFGARSAPSGPVQAGMMPLPRIYIHSAPSIASNITDTLQHNDFVRLIGDHPDLGWVEVATRSGQQGWVERSFVDFSRAIKSSSPNFDLSSALTPTPAPTHPARTFYIQLRGGDNNPKKAYAAGRAQACGEAIQNGDFEAGLVTWTEESPGVIIRNDWPDPYQGSWVAWFGGVDATERLTQLFHVPADVQDAQKLEFYIKVTTEETGTQVRDTFALRFLNGSGVPITTSDVAIANNTTPTDWLRIGVDLNGMAGFADQDMQIQFEAVVDATNNTQFVIDSVSLNLICVAAQTPTPVYYVYLPVALRSPPPTATATPTSTPRPSATPCPSHNPCPSHCSSDCTSDCPSDCGYVCVYDCPLDCVYHCGYDYCSYDCSFDW